MRKLALAGVGLLLLAGALVLVAPTDAFAAKPPKCTNCAPTIVVGGRTCTLVACGFDCVYQCPF